MPPVGPSHPPGFPIPAISLTITFFAIFVLWFKRHRFSFDRWFVFFLLGLSCLHFAHLLRRGFGRSYFDFFHIPQLLLGPLFFLYLKDITGIGVRRKDWFHFLPYLVFVFLFFLFRIQEESRWLSDFFFGPAGWVLKRTTFVSLLFYSIFSYCRIYKLEKEPINPAIESLQFGWLKLLIVLVFLILIYQTVFFFWNELSDSSLEGNLPPIRGYDILIFTILFSLFGVRQSMIHSAWLLGQNDSVPAVKKRKYERSGLEFGKLNEYAVSIKEFMDLKKPYLDCEFSLDQLAESLKVPRAHVTQALNEVLETNFYNFINEYRVREFIRLLDTIPEEKAGVLNLAFDAGFNSKSTFNQAFKRIMGTTPSLYISEKREKNES
ncbi:helix-turn-helix transcriptional regulator [Leptospira sp. 201903070]|uniref:Helix-turn-helix transcriptional regulator n=1 Tax=Leptospira ainlahdjerensis TaxID=2810033 RepID=A0ABS2U827_9LEPT|nr:AraC family transcriptional regulator [Leptospira ainlahdjerensis]MBM9576279.1 helix-turn-helix transcriptional regulator [Leptospira ainlahdjerensis]